MLLNWPIVALSGIKGDRPFADLASVLDSSACWSQVGWSVYSIATTETIESCPTYVYGYLSLPIFYFFGSFVSVGALGWIIAISLLALLGYASQLLKGIPKVHQASLGVALVLSPSLQLLFERANVDLIMAFLVVSASLLISQGKMRAAILVLGISAMIKFYTLPIFLLLVSLHWLDRSTRSTPIAAFGFLVASGTVLNYLSVEQTPEPNQVAFGVEAFSGYFDWFGISGSEFWLALLSILVIVISGTLILGGSNFRSKSWKTPKLSSFGAFELATMVFLSNYFLVMSYDYRLIFLGIALLSATESKFPSRATFLTWKFSAWLALVASSAFGVGVAKSSGINLLFLATGGFQLLGDVSILVVVVISLVALLGMMKTEGARKKSE